MPDLHSTVYGTTRGGIITTDAPVPLPADGVTLTFGRDPAAGITLPHPQVSRLHAAVTSTGGRAAVMDLGSANGTFVNGRRLPPNRDVRLDPGDHLDIGPYAFAVEESVLLPRSRLNNIELVASAVGRTVTDRQTGQPLPLLHEVGLVFRPGEFVCLIGPSGSGKSTLMNILSGRAAPDAGVVLLNGRNLHASFDALKEDIAYVPQKDVMHDKLTVGEALTFTALLRLPPDITRAERQAGVDDILGTVALSHRKGTRLSHLSGGQTKRASLANEILSQPSLLFLDEVTSGLDEQTDRDMMALFRRVADAGKTVVCITHSLANVEGNCSLVVVLTPGGRVAFVGPPSDAITYFGVTKLGDVYTKLAERTPEEWQKRFRDTQQHQTYVTERLETVSPAPPRPPRRPELVAKATAGVRQSVLLAVRYLLIWKGSPGALLSLMGQTLLVALLLCGLFGQLRDLPEEATAPSVLVEVLAKLGMPTPNEALMRKVTRTENLLFLLAVSAFWFGCNTAAKELVKERTIFHREQDYNLLSGSYLASKLAVLAGIGLLQVSVLFAVVKGWCDPPGDWLGQWVVLLALSLAGTALGLAISAVAGSEEVAIAMIPVVVIPQIVLSGAIAPLNGWMKGLAQMCVTTYWGKHALDQLLPEQIAEAAQRAEVAEEGSYWVAGGMVLAHAAAYLLLALAVLWWRGRRR